MVRANWLKIFLLVAVALPAKAQMAPPLEDPSSVGSAAPVEVPKAKAVEEFDRLDPNNPLRDEFREVAGELRCPTCTGLSVLESDASFSVQIKDIVKEKVKAGESKEQILKYFTERYGPWILRSPPAVGFNVLAWAIPIGLLLAGPPLIWFFVWRKRRFVGTQGVRSTDAIIKELQDRLDAARAAPGRR